MKKPITYLTCLAVLLTCTAAFAGSPQPVTLTREYTYQASELDSKISCRAIALEQVRRELLAEIGTLIESRTVVRDNQVIRDEIKTLTAGVVQTRIIDEKWDGREYWLLAQVSADPEEVAAAIEKLKNDDQLAQELAESRAAAADALACVERLKEELARSGAGRENQDQYNSAVSQLQAAEFFERGVAFSVAGNYEEAALAYNRAIYLRPDDAKAYFNRSVVYINMGVYGRAAADIKRAMLLKPASTGSYYRRASVYKNTRESRLSGRQPHSPGASGRPEPDVLQKFLARKQSQHNLERVNPQERRPFTLRDRERSRAPLPLRPGPLNEQPQLKKEKNIPPLHAEKKRLPAKPLQKIAPRKETDPEQERKQPAGRQGRHEQKTGHHPPPND